ncbi:hypothetical protein MPSEU_000453700 [Mayamaea pseudoterrestris]|nr:hypothetical protein MPSEU_000453700 [Mayamaea pseudoterrestris]
MNMQTPYFATPCTIPLTARSHNVTPPPPEGFSRVDVLCGRQSFVLRHEGNRNYSRIVQSYSTQYKECINKRSKAKITSLVIEQIQLQGGRFLKLEQNVWTELDQQSTLEKVQHALRSTKPKTSPGRAKPSRGTARSVIVETSQEEDEFFKTILAKQQCLYEELLSGSTSSSQTSVSTTTTMDTTTALAQQQCDFESLLPDLTHSQQPIRVS